MTLIAAAVLVLLCGSCTAPVRAQQNSTSAPQSEVREFEHLDSRALGGDLVYSLYLPPGYGQGDRRYPVLYLLHGAEGNHLEWLHTGYVRETLDKMIAEGSVAPMIVVMPDGGGNSWYVDSKDVGGPGNYATAISFDLVQHIDATLRTKAEPRYRAVGGLSMGGFGALRFAFQQPFRYVAAASFSGAFWARVTPDTVLGDWAQRIFEGSFGRPFDAARFLAQSPMTMVDQLKDVSHPPVVYLTVGDQDRYKLYNDTFELFHHMRELGLPVEMRMTAGDHEWETWAAELPDALLFIDRAFKHGS
ncbi:MAG: prolyl oligopeptidase family serine peptidase [Alphaproteobacteria bacterium]|nr:prolyl oligopeptidase family serine peptidase [Alphaproteobacteria bacterium]